MNRWVQVGAGGEGGRKWVAGSAQHVSPRLPNAGRADCFVLRKDTAWHVASAKHGRTSGATVGHGKAGETAVSGLRQSATPVASKGIQRQKRKWRSHLGKELLPARRHLHSKHGTHVTRRPTRGCQDCPAARHGTGECCSKCGARHIQGMFSSACTSIPFSPGHLLGMQACGHTHTPACTHMHTHALVRAHPQ